MMYQNTLQCKEKKKSLSDATIDVSIVNSTKKFKQKMKLVNEPEYKTFEYINTFKMKNDRVEIQNYSQLFENNKLTWKSDDFEISIKSVVGKEKRFIRNIKIK